MKRSDRGRARSDITHMIMCMLSGVRLMKSQKLSCADCACGNPESGSSFTAWMSVQFDREAANITGQIKRALVARDGREPHKRRRAFTRTLEQIGAGIS